MAGLALDGRAGVTVLDERGHLNRDESGGFILATYREIAAHFALSGPNAARTKVKRAGWSAAPTNHPADPLHIRVPRDAWYQAAETPHPKRPERPHATSRDAPSPKPDTPHIRTLEAAVSSLTERAETAEKRADRAENRADRAEARADRAEQAIEAEQNRADRAELALAGERTRADALRDRVEDLQRQFAEAEAEGNDLTIETAELTAQLKQVREEAQDAAHAAAELRQADAERRARGLLARLRAAWRGERERT